MGGVTYGDVFFILAVCALIWGLMALMNRSRKALPANPPSVPDPGAGDDLMRRILKESRTAALVGLFHAAEGADARVLRFLRGAGFTVFPVSEDGGTLEGGTVFQGLENLPLAADLVVITLPGPLVSPWANRAVAAGAGALWLEKGIISPEAMQIARERGLLFVMNHSIEEEHRRLLGSPR